MEIEEEKSHKFFKPGPRAAILVFLFVIVCMLFIFSFAQYYLGMWGLIITEVGFVIISLSAALVFNVDLKEMLPFKRIKVNEFFGTLIIWSGAFLIDILINLVIFYFFPGGLEVSAELTDFFAQWPVAASIFVVSVTPAICEEMLHRGFIQTCISKRVHNKWLICFIMAIFFGLFHMDIYRFMGTAILGGVMAYILIETGNFWYNMLFHFANNFFVVALAMLSSNLQSDAAAEITANGIELSNIALYFIIGSAAPLLMLGGSMLLKGMERLKQEGKKKIITSIIIASVFTVLLFTIGIIILIGLILSGGVQN